MIKQVGTYTYPEGSPTISTFIMDRCPNPFYWIGITVVDLRHRFSTHTPDPATIVETPEGLGWPSPCYHSTDGFWFPNEAILKVQFKLAEPNPSSTAARWPKRRIKV